ncbi:MAG: serine/threonine-protein phosphatase, partial [Spirochaetia bacterium]|nr:serine/threonine-protein phosphatase [Spirochaetia bacterium]
FVVLAFSPHNALGLKNFLFMEATSLVIQAVFVIYILSKEDSLRAVYRQKQMEIQKAQATLFALLPDAVKPIRGLEAGGYFSPSEDLGGDFLDLRSCRHGLLVLMADCSGHGIGASLNAVLLKTVCDRHLPELEKNGKPEIFLSRINRDIAEYNQSGQYHAILAALVDPAKGELRYANAGAKAPVLIRNKVSERLPVPQGFLLGYEKEVRYESSRVRLQSGDRIFFHSDALTEIISPKTGLSIFGDKQLEVRLASYPFQEPQKDLQGIHDLVIRENRGRALRDDLTMVLVEFSKKRAGKPKAPTLFIDKSFSLKENFA